MTTVVTIKKSYAQDYTMWFRGHGVKLKSYSEEDVASLGHRNDMVFWRPIIAYQKGNHVLLHVDFYFPDQLSSLSTLFKLTFG